LAPASKWRIEWEESALKELKKLGPAASTAVRDYLKHRVLKAADPRQFGKALLGDKFGLWRYRVGDYRIVCRFEDAALVVLVVRVGHRREVYER
jgi:mRNA interferase RelE/StbE